MNIKINRMNKIEVGNLRAFVDVTVNNLIIKGFKIISGSNGLFVSNPSEKNEKDNKYYETVRFESMEDKTEFQNFILSRYNGEQKQEIEDDTPPF